RRVGLSLAQYECEHAYSHRDWLWHRGDRSRRILRPGYLWIDDPIRSINPRKSTRILQRYDRRMAPWHPFIYSGIPSDWVCFPVWASVDVTMDLVREAHARHGYPMQSRVARTAAL